MALGNHTNSSSTCPVKVDAAGRIIVPAEARSLLGIRPGDTLIVSYQADGLQVKTREQITRETQDYFCSLAPADRILSDELIQERRREAEAE